MIKIILFYSIFQATKVRVRYQQWIQLFVISVPFHFISNSFYDLWIFFYLLKDWLWKYRNIVNDSSILLCSRDGKKVMMIIKCSILKR
jgi:hypothetical protein